MKLKQPKICCRQSSKTASCFESATEVKFHVNIAYAQVNPLCSCKCSMAVLIVGRRKLTLPQSGMAFSVCSIFFSIREILTESRR